MLKLESCPPLQSHLSYSARKGVAASFVENVLKNDTYIDEVILDKNQSSKQAVSQCPSFLLFFFFFQADEANKFLELIAPWFATRRARSTRPRKSLPRSRT